MKKKELLKSFCFAIALSLTLSLIPLELHAESYVHGEIISKESAFNENAHGKVLEEGECGEGANYKLYTDETLYIYGSGIVTGKTDFESRFSEKYVSYVYIEDGIAGIGKSAFDKCKDIKTVRLPAGIKEIAYYGFAYCESLKEIKLPDSLEIIGESAFFYCKSLTEINIPKEVKTIQEMTFSCCNNLKKVIFSENIKTIEKNAFTVCSSLEELNFPDGLESIGESSFKTCLNLKKIIIPRNCNLIDSQAFLGCSKLTKAFIPDSVQKIRNEAFSDCGSWGNPLIIYCNKNTEAERYAKENGIQTKPASDFNKIDIKNKFKGYTGIPINISISCNPTDDFSFECEDSCGIKSKYCGQSYISTETSQYFSKNYEITFKKSGTHIVSVFKNGIPVENDKFTVKNASVKISKTKLKIKKGSSYTLGIKKQTKGDKVSKWVSTKPKVVSVNKKTGKIKALKKGKAKITLTMKSGCKATCTVTVK